MKEKPRSCKTVGCRTRPQKNRLVCSKCRTAEYRKANPIKAAYAHLRNGAKRRKIEFAISLEEFSVFCEETKVLLGRGRFKESFHIDRIDFKKGYVAGNLQKLTCSQNSRKGTVEKKLLYEWQRGEFRFVDVARYAPDFSDVPF